MNEIDDRRQRAREAYADEPEPRTFAAVEAAIETATRVQITPEMLARAYPGMETETERSHCSLLFANALRAAGFEVVEAGGGNDVR